MCNLYQIFSGDQIKNNVIGGARNTYGREERCMQRETWWKEATWKTRARWEDNMKIDLQEVAWGDMEWSDMARDRGKWRKIVNAVTNIRVT